MFEKITYNVKEHIGIITYNSPANMNAHSPKSYEELSAVLSMAAGNPEVRVIVITGGETLFGAGTDLKCKLPKAGSYESYVYTKLTHEVSRKFEKIDTPVIAAIGGYCLGGHLEIALSCDIRVASENATFGFPEAQIAGIPGMGGTQRLPRTIGKSMAKYLMMSCEKIHAERALEIGLVDFVAPDGHLLERALEIAGRIAKSAPLALKMIKRTVNDGLDSPLEIAMGVEALAMFGLSNSEDTVEGIQSFREHRKPNFKGQ